MNKQKLKFAFRVNGNKDIGMGHLMRCLYLAEYLQSPSLFLINNNEKMAAKVKEFGHTCYLLSSLTEKDFEVMIDALKKYPKPVEKVQPSEKEELEEIKEQLRLANSDVLITDLISPSDHYLDALKKMGVRLVSIDELGQATFPSDLVFNCNAISRSKKYKVSKKTKVFMGQQYALLRRNFYEGVGMPLRQTVQKILVTCGGTDMKGLSLKILKALEPFSHEIEIIFVQGFDFKFQTELAQLLEGMHNIKVLKNVKDMRPWMQSADVAIASGGTTMYELAALGIPTIILDQYEHQNEFASEMERQGGVINLNLGEKINSKTIEKALVDILPLEKRRMMSLTAQKIIDGKGAMRVAKIIQEIAA